MLLYNIGRFEFGNPAFSIVLSFTTTLGVSSGSHMLYTVGPVDDLVTILRLRASERGGVNTQAILPCSVSSRLGRELLAREF